MCADALFNTLIIWSYSLRPIYSNNSRDCAYELLYCLLLKNERVGISYTL